MHAIHLIPIAFFAVAASPAAAGQTTACWTYGAPTGIFEWQNSPSLACREGRSVDGSAPISQVTAQEPATPEAKVSSKSASNTEVTFSGEVYFGMAATF